MDIKIYKKNFEQDKGRVIAAVQREDLVDDCKVWLFTDIDPVQYLVYEGEAMKIQGIGRPLWTQITNEMSGKWLDVTSCSSKPLDIKALLRELENADNSGIEMIKLNCLFDRPEIPAGTAEPEPLPE